jgi:hypothetical protein
MSFRATRPTRRMVRSIGIALSCLVLAFAIVTGLFQANTRYFYCESMGLLRVDPCVATAHRDELPPPTDEVSRTPFTCCATGVLGAIPSATSLDELRIPSAKLVGVVVPPSAIVAPMVASGLVPEQRRAHRERIPPRPARELRAQSMVFLT